MCSHVIMSRQLGMNPLLLTAVARAVDCGRQSRIFHETRLTTGCEIQTTTWPRLVTQILVFRCGFLMEIPERAIRRSMA